MSRRRYIAAGVALLLLGFAVFSYPFVSDWLYKRAQAEIVSDQVSVVKELSEEDLSAEREAAYRYNEQLRNHRVVITDPFDPNAIRPNDEQYWAVMNVAGDGVMGTICIPKINVQLPVYHTVDDDVLAKGVGHLQETSLPIGGESCHCVLSGHTGLPSVRIFDRLEELVIDDWFVLRVLGEDHAYRVYETEVVLPEETESLAVQEGRDLVTLVTCTPYGINSHRLLVHAERCEVPQEWYDMLDGSGNADMPYSLREMTESTLPYVLAGAVVGLGAALLLVLYLRRRRRTER